MTMTTEDYRIEHAEQHEAGTIAIWSDRREPGGFTVEVRVPDDTHAYGIVLATRNALRHMSASGPPTDDDLHYSRIKLGGW